MKRSEWTEISSRLLLRWPNANISPETVELWFTELEAFSAEQVRGAIDGYYVEGHEWPPNGGIVYSRVIRDAMPSFEECVRAIESYLHAAEHDGLAGVPGELLSFGGLAELVTIYRAESTLSWRRELRRVYESYLNQRVHRGELSGGTPPELTA